MFPISPTAYDVNFRFLGFPIRIHPFFWVMVFIFFMQVPVDTLIFWLCRYAVWCSALFVSVLVHELGHAFVFRYVFSVESEIILHGLGGLTIPHRSHRRSYGVQGTLLEILLNIAGCLAGFILAAIAFVLFINVGSGYGIGTFNPMNLLREFLFITLFVCIIWGVVNLLPIYPLDGGHISREIFLFFSPRNGLKFSLVLSLITAIICAIACLNFQLYFVAIFCGFWAYQNFIDLQQRSFRF
ncbi:MAG: site-2 protease family protein [Planctomycetaceae bacterium]|jgi:Zn-dependent protease|nr:site-2 protease family protein [Planctomycetaceae bacterium]